MVYYFTSNVVSPPATIYVGKDKFENEELIKHGWEEDVWYHQLTPPVSVPPSLYCLRRFHADNLSSAHVYLRMAPEQKWNELPQALVEDCAQLTKANSIEGNKKDNVTVIYTPWSNLLKNSAMATGQVSFHEPKKVKSLLIPTRLNPTINRLAKTRTTASTDTLAPAKEAHLSELRKIAHAERKEKQKEEERVKRERKEEKWRREHAYEDLQGDGGEARSNQEGWDEDDFM